MIKKSKGKKDRGPDLGSHLHMDCYKGVKREEQESVGDEDGSEGEGSQAEARPGSELQEGPKRSQRVRSQLGQYPILVKGKQVHYVPWGSQDLEGLASRLPNIHSGASKWIRMFEEAMTGKLLAVGDLKALLARVIGLAL